MLLLLLLPMVRRRRDEVPLCPLVLYHLLTCLPLPYLTDPFPVPNPWWPFRCLHWWLCPICVHVSIVLAVESWLGWGKEIWFPKYRGDLAQKTEICIVSMISYPGSFCISFWTLFCLRPSSSEFQAFSDETFYWRAPRLVCMDCIPSADKTHGCCCTILSDWIYFF